MNYEIAFWLLIGGLCIYVATREQRKQEAKLFEREPSLSETYAGDQLRQWEDSLISAECDIAMFEFAQIADDPNIHPSVKDAIFLVGTKIVPTLEEA